MSDMREAFERWYDEATDYNYGVAYYVDINDRYCFADIEIAWQAWQAARAQGDAEPVGFIPSSGLDNLNAGHPARVYPVGAEPSPFGSRRLIYTQPPQEAEDDE